MIASSEPVRDTPDFFIFFGETELAEIENRGILLG